MITKTRGTLASRTLAQTLAILIGLSATAAAQVPPVGPIKCAGNCSSPTRPGSGPLSPRALNPATDVYFESLTTSGEFFVVTQDGRRLAGQNAVRVPLGSGSRMVTGPTGRASIVLPDETLFTVGPNSSFILDEFVYDPATFGGKITANPVYGAFRFITGKIARKDPSRMKVRLPGGATIGFRGTDVEMDLEPGGGGSIRLHSGQIEISSFDFSEDVLVLNAGQMVSWSTDYRLGAPVPFPRAPRP